MHNWITALNSRNQYNIVDQPHLNFLKIHIINKIEAHSLGEKNEKILNPSKSNF